MPNLLKFPMGKLCFDLVLEVIDELDPKDVPELMIADRRFRWILLQKPARILGKQIHLISVMMEDRDLSYEGPRKRYQDLVFIMKFAESRPLPFYFMSHKVLLLSQVERCSVLEISDVWYDALNEEKLSGLKKGFANLKQVDELEVSIWGNNFNDFLYNLKAEVTDRASLRFSNLQGEIHQQLMLSLINGSLQNCKMISVQLYRDPDFYPTVYSALSKTQLELFVTGVPFGSVKSTIELILNSGIPSENKEAACLVRGRMELLFYTLIKNFPGIREVNEPNKALIVDTMRETLRKHRFMDNYCGHSRSGSPRPRAVSAESLSVSADSRSDSDDSRSGSDDSLSVSAESAYCDRSRSPPPAPPRSRSVSVFAESLDSMDRNPMKRGVEHDESLSVSDNSLSDSDHSLRSMDRSPIKKRVRHSVSLGGPIDRSPPPRSRPRSVSVSAESLSVSGDSRSDSDDSLHSLDRSPAKRAFDRCHHASVDCPFDCYLKRINEKRDCIYVVCHGFFFAKYVSSIQF